MHSELFSAECLFSECLLISLLTQFAALCGFPASSGAASVRGGWLAECECLAALPCTVLLAPGEEILQGDHPTPDLQPHR